MTDEERPLGPPEILDEALGKFSAYAQAIYRRLIAAGAGPVVAREVAFTMKGLTDYGTLKAKNMSEQEIAAYFVDLFNRRGTINSRLSDRALGFLKRGAHLMLNRKKKILTRLGMTEGQLTETYWKLMASGAGPHVARAVTNDESLLAEYLEMKKTNVSDLAIAAYFVELVTRKGHYDKKIKTGARPL